MTANETSNNDREEKKQNQNKNRAKQHRNMDWCVSINKCSRQCEILHVLLDTCMYALPASSHVYRFTYTWPIAQKKKITPRKKRKRKWKKWNIPKRQYIHLYVYINIDFWMLSYIYSFGRAFSFPHTPSLPRRMHVCVLFVFISDSVFIFLFRFVSFHSFPVPLSNPPCHLVHLCLFEFPFTHLFIHLCICTPPCLSLYRHRFYIDKTTTYRMYTYLFICICTRTHTVCIPFPKEDFKGPQTQFICMLLPLHEHTTVCVCLYFFFFFFSSLFHLHVFHTYIVLFV